MRQSAFALVGDLARCCISAVSARLGELVALALANLEPRVATAEGNNSASNNACWALGEVAIKVRARVGVLVGGGLLLGAVPNLPACPPACPPARLPARLLAGPRAIRVRPADPARGPCRPAPQLRPEALQPHAEAVAEKLATLLALRTQRNLAENAAISLGRLAWMCAPQIAPHLAHFCGTWCQVSL